MVALMALRERAVIVACLLAASFGYSEENNLLRDDECKQSGSSCSQYALQRRARRAELDEAFNCKDLQDIDNANCQQEVTWAKETGLKEHPEWYPGLSFESSPLEFQCKVYQSNPDKCPKPCGVSCKKTSAPTHGP
ncbi:unnamed protein product [Durusdinium trenchii]|uniref:Uncharacterized protein n=1 Tax=Durusdinium trenchii TaxID=1381693 RepID=A0ABP0MTF4_9DINO